MKIIKTKEELAKHKDKIIPALIWYGFIPRKLHINDRPELGVFPLNILFMKYRSYYGEMQSGTSLYEPVIDSYEDIIDRQRLLYRNIYNPRNKIIIVYYPEEEKYEGHKYVNGECVLQSYGLDWKIFFTHLTMGGLQNGEGCKFKKED